MLGLRKLRVGLMGSSWLEIKDPWIEGSWVLEPGLEALGCKDSLAKSSRERDENSRCNVKSQVGFSWPRITYSILVGNIGM